ncbi:MAG: hypothetical protein AAF961_15380, partial [Planctomycetota bacterium]
MCRRVNCWRALASIAFFFAVVAGASAQEEGDAESPVVEAPNDPSAATGRVASPPPTSATWATVSLAALFLLWVMIGDWVNRDSQIHELGYKQWNPIIFFPFAVLGLALLFAPFNIWIRLSLLTLSILAPAIPYVVIHNKNVQSHQTVLTGSWWRFVVSSLLGKIGVKVSTERKAEYEKGAPVDLIAMGAENANEDNANLLIARQSPGYLLVKDLVVEIVQRRSEKALLNYGPQSVGVKHEIDGVWHPAEARDRESGDVMLAVMKTLANLQVKERRKKQEGQFGAKFDGRTYLCPITSQGVESGERVIVSLLSEKNRPDSYQALGMREALRIKRSVSSIETSTSVVRPSPGSVAKRAIPLSIAMISAHLLC